MKHPNSLVCLVLFVCLFVFLLLVVFWIIYILYILHSKPEKQLEDVNTYIRNVNLVNLDLN